MIIIIIMINITLCNFLTFLIIEDTDMNESSSSNWLFTP
jgi:hypothetical protein